MIVVPVVYGQLLKIGTGKLSAAPSADPWIHLQGLLTVAMASRLAFLPGFGDDLIEFLF